MMIQIEHSMCTNCTINVILYHLEWVRYSIETLLDFRLKLCCLWRTLNLKDSRIFCFCHSFCRNEILASASSFTVISNTRKFESQKPMMMLTAFVLGAKWSPNWRNASKQGTIVPDDPTLWLTAFFLSRTLYSTFYLTYCFLQTTKLIKSLTPELFLASCRIFTDMIKNHHR